MWGATDYAIAGELCPFEDILDKVDEIRGSLGASSLVVLVCEQDGVVPSLTLVSSGAPDEARRLNATMAGFDFADELRGLSSAAADLAFGRNDPEVSKRVIGENLVAHRVWTNPPFIMPLSTPRPAQLVSPVFLVRGRPARLSDRDAEHLLAMLNANSRARARLDARVMADVDQTMVPHITDAGLVDLVGMAERAAALARRVTRSESARLYLRDPHGSAPLSIVFPDDEVDLLAYETELKELTRRVLDSHRADTADGAGHIALATPVPGPFASPHAPAVGVLTVLREHSREFSAYELALLRNICLRVAVVHATAASGGVAQAIAQLPSMSSDALADVGNAIEPSTHTAVPPDVRLGLTGVPEALERLARTTNSQSVSVRLALSDPSATEPHGLALRRVAAFPPSRMDDRLRVQYERHGGLNWRTVRNGRRTYSADVTTEADYTESRKETRSELSVPIRIGGQLRGTLNLESATVGNYGPFMPLVDALAGAIGRRLADAEAHHSQLVLERAAEVFDDAHYYEGRLQELRAKSEAIAVDAAEREAIITYIDKCIELISGTLRKKRANELVPHSTVDDVIQAALAKKHVLSLELPRDSQIAELQHQLTETEARLLHAATRNILSNLKKHGGKSALADDETHQPPRMLYDACTWDGRRYALISYTNPVMEFVKAEDAYRIYRLPIERDNILRLGAYLAALRLRELGGMLHFSINPDQVARTVMMIPTVRTRVGQM